MSWWTSVVEGLVNKSAVSQVGVFDLEGNCLAQSEELLLHPRCAKALVTGFNDRSGSLFGIHVGQTQYTCYRAGDNVIIGKSTDIYGSTTTFAAMLTERCLLFCLMNGSSTIAGGLGQGSVISVMRSALSNANKPQNPKLELPLECRIKIVEEQPLIDLGIQH